MNQYLLKSIILLAFILLSGCGKPQAVNLPPESGKMRYLLFPLRPDAAPYRAILVDGNELGSSSIITYYKDNQLQEINVGELTLTPGDAAQSYIDGLNQEIKRWGDNTDYRQVKFSIRDNNADLLITMKNGKKCSYRYQIDPPLKVKNTGCVTFVF